MVHFGIQGTGSHSSIQSDSQGGSSWRPGSRKRSSRQGGVGRPPPPTGGRLPERLAAVKFARDVPKGEASAHLYDKTTIFLFELYGF
jgi:hypothetical protein